MSSGYEYFMRLSQQSEPAPTGGLVTVIRKDWPYFFRERAESAISRVSRWADESNLALRNAYETVRIAAQLPGKRGLSEAREAAINAGVDPVLVGLAENGRRLKIYDLDELEDRVWDQVDRARKIERIKNGDWER